MLLCVSIDPKKSVHNENVSTTRRQQQQTSHRQTRFVLRNIIKCNNIFISFYIFFIFYFIFFIQLLFV